MDEWIVTIIITPMAGVISTLFWLYVKELRAGIDVRDERIKGLEDDLKKYTDTLYAVADTQERLTGMIRTILDRMETGDDAETS